MVTKLKSELLETEHKETKDLILNLGPSHPSMHGIIHNVVELEDETIKKATPVVGYLHRAFEKLAEQEHYQQFNVHMDRLNYVSAPINNVGWNCAIEKLLGIETPKKVDYVRVIFSELARIADHIVCLGILGVDLGAYTPFLYVWHQREKIYQIYESMTGARLTTNFSRIGGLERDIPGDFVQRVQAFLKEFPSALNEFDQLLTRNKIFYDRTRGISPVTAEDAIARGFSGPNLRAAGVAKDLRKQRPYSSYQDFDFDIPVGTSGDCYDRYSVRLMEMRESLKIIKQALDNLDVKGPWHADVPKIYLPEKKEVYTQMKALIIHFKIIMDGVCPPKKDLYFAVEATNGELGWYIVSDGTGKPYRVHLRRPSFWTYQNIPSLIEGGYIADAVATISSLNIIAGELDA